MWIMLNRAFLSIVDKASDPSKLLVRARRKGEIATVFLGAKEIADAGTDYAFRAEVDREYVARAIAAEILGIDYPNFKGSVRDRERHDAYMDVWNAMMRYQQRTRRPRRGPRAPLLRGGLEYDRIAAAQKAEQGIGARRHTRGFTTSERPLTACQAAKDGDCFHEQCPQLRDGEPRKSGRHCPLDAGDED